MSTSNGQSSQPNSMPQHVAIIMDGNGRWANTRFLERVEGHRAGAKAVRSVVEEARKLGIRYLTLFSFSTENWERPKAEVTALMALFGQYLESELELMLKNGIRLRALGDLDRLPDKLKSILFNVMEQTKENTDMQLILAVSYGGRDELVYAARKIAKQVESGSLDPMDIDAATISSNLYLPDIPDPDLLIRTSSESRISNFLLWQLAYTEIVISSCLWPDFNAQEFRNCLDEFSSRERRFGLTQGQLQAR